MIDTWVKVQNRWATLRDSLFWERGAVATEYGLLLMLIALAIIAAAFVYGVSLAGLFSGSAGQVENPTG